ncbi:hypothetical protein POUND7_015556 [Theobroma cacao]
MIESHGDSGSHVETESCESYDTARSGELNDMGTLDEIGQRHSLSNKECTIDSNGSLGQQIEQPSTATGTTVTADTSVMTGKRARQIPRKLADYDFVLPPSLTSSSSTHTPTPKANSTEFVKAVIAYEKKLSSSVSVPKTLQLNQEMEKKRKIIVQSFSIASSMYTSGSRIISGQESELEVGANFPEVSTN